MKRTVAILLALVLLLSFAVPLYAEDVASGRLILGSEVFLEAGETKTIPVEIKDAGMLSVIQFVVEYDSTKLELQNVTPTVIAGKEVNIVTGAEEGTILDGVDSQVSHAKAQISQPEAGKVSIIWESENQINGDGIIAYLTFQALEDEIGRAGVSLSQDPEDEFIFKEDSQDKVPTEDIIGGVEEEPMVETKYTVSFNAGKGTGAPAAVKTIDGKVTIPDVTPVYEGHVFLGWATTSNATEAEYERGETYDITKDINLFAVWVKTPKIVVGEVKGRAGETVEVPVSIENNPGVASGDITISYNKNIMELKNIKVSALMSSGMSAPNAKDGIISFMALDNIKGDGEMYVLEFEIKDTAPDGSYPISISGNVYNSSSETVNVVFENGSVKVVSVEPGDVDGNGIINSLDAMRILQCSAKILKLEDLAYPEVADFDGNGIVNSLDAMKTLRKAAHLD
ncbi:MAG: InlB B-repeat-containing protein [Oscillospiraceae bacterium]|nr:InlB B-repeat-containing protein [Oscillospiraceae bacterium]